MRAALRSRVQALLLLRLPRAKILMTVTGEAIGAVIGTIIFWAVFCGLTLLTCAAVDVSRKLRRIRRRRRNLELQKHLQGWEWPPL